MRKGIFIPDITVEIFRNASLEAVEELLVSGSMEDVEIPERPRGEWIKVWGIFYQLKCSKCNFELKSPDDKSNFCPNCGASMISSNSEIEKSKSEIENPCKTCTKYIGNMCEQVCEKRYEYVMKGGDVE